jgi:predicted kinase
VRLRCALRGVKKTSRVRTQTRLLRDAQLYYNINPPEMQPLRRSPHPRPVQFLLMMARKLILVAGYAASGKTRVGMDLARKLPACYLDKDTLATPLVERLLECLRLPAGDRDSDRYRESVRPLEYSGLVAAGLESAQLGVDVVLSAPFLAQLTDQPWTGDLAAQAEARDLKLRVVWVACDAPTLRVRMAERGSMRDRAKIIDWRAYSASVNERLDEKFALPAFRFDNSGLANYDTSFAKLLEWLKAD